MKFRYYLVIAMIWLIHPHAVAQKSESDQSLKKNAFSGNILGTASYLGFTYERYLYQRFSIEVGVGLIGLGTGLSYYPFRMEAGKVKPYIGLKYTSHAIVDGPHKIVTYIPIGITFFSSGQINIGCDIGPSYVQHQSPGFKPTPEELARYPYTDFSVFGNLKLGIRF